MGDREKVARLVLRADGSTYSNRGNHEFGAGEYEFDVDMGNFATNADPLVYIELEYVSPLVMSTALEIAPGTPGNRYDAVEIFCDIPQYNSYDSGTQTQTMHMATLEREWGNNQTIVYADDVALNNPAVWQIWSFKHKKSHMVMRPEVLQKKRWRIRVVFTDDDEVGRYSNISDYMTFINDFHMVFSVSK